MLRRISRPSMRPLLALLTLALLLLPAAASAAAVEPTPGACTNAGCARTADTDGDGAIDWASVASGGEHYGVNLVWRGADGELWYEAIANGDDHDEHYLFAWSGGHAHYAGDHRHADGGVVVGEAHGPTGTAEEHAWLWFGAGIPPHLP